MATSAFKKYNRFEDISNLITVNNINGSGRTGDVIAHCALYKIGNLVVGGMRFKSSSTGSDVTKGTYIASGFPLPDISESDDSGRKGAPVISTSNGSGYNAYIESGTGYLRMDKYTTTLTAGSAFTFSIMYPCKASV